MGLVGAKQKGHPHPSPPHKGEKKQHKNESVPFGEVIYDHD